MVIRCDLKLAQLELLGEHLVCRIRGILGRLLEVLACIRLRILLISCYIVFYLLHEEKRIIRVALIFLLHIFDSLQCFRV